MEVYKVPLTGILKPVWYQSDPTVIEKLIIFMGVLFVLFVFYVDGIIIFVFFAVFTASLFPILPFARIVLDIWGLISRS